ncbi:DUF6794 domain-containing protein [Dokdonia ponticola]|uniref:DUF6794 domain-containing protein n=1 Tax=Dokdonia ponticola TaxID=2041041 RepID=A0ABV9HZ78_9FLAO
MEKYQPKNLREAVEILEKIIPQSIKNEVLNSESYGEFNGISHFGFGLDLRNNFSMWDENSPLVINTGTSGDQLSATVLKCFYYHLKRTSREVIYDPEEEMEAFRNQKSSIDIMELFYNMLLIS